MRHIPGSARWGTRVDGLVKPGHDAEHLRASADVPMLSCMQAVSQHGCMHDPPPSPSASSEWRMALRGTRQCRSNDVPMDSEGTHKSSLIFGGLPNCAEVERWRLKQRIQTRVWFTISRSCFSGFGLTFETTWRLRSVAILHGNVQSTARSQAGVQPIPVLVIASTVVDRTRGLVFSTSSAERERGMGAA